LEKWSFPENLVSAVNWHHDPDKCEDNCTFSDIVHVANILGLMTGFGNGGGDGFETVPFNVVTERLGFKLDDLELLAAETRAGVDKLADVLMTN